MQTRFLALCLSLLVGKIAAHGAVQSYVINGVLYEGYQPFLPPDDQVTIGRPFPGIDPLRGTDNMNLSCNNDGWAAPRQISAPIRAGDSITAIWGPWIHPFGPAIVYMARCPSSCSLANSIDLDWFKIDQTGLIEGNVVDGFWGLGIVRNEGVYTVTIPAALADGEYLIRHELISLHGEGGPQYYPECAQLEVTGGGGSLPPKRFLATLPGAYKPTDPGLTLDLYDPASWNIYNYTVPGPDVWKGEVV
ncbi:cellulose-growth-specific protein [Coprinopsis marcescibilis]|uniref:AA9 family lytic polysaccharide monooxygenase n=1 Tax=Coprinopsis marcescibilis TaxID=230819 RepID=A0A5C3KX82_COPMA|nr:cellulose-growth-specific protein [Coprinopsis marcescibilis]